jgi:hypothetical protein
MEEPKNEKKFDFDNIKETAKEAFNSVKEEAEEVVQEAKATVQGQKLDTADTVGAAGYRENSGASGTAIASLVLGILSLICALFGWSSIAGLVFGIIGVVLGAKARKEAQTGLATAGFVCSLLGMILCAVGLVCAIACAGAAGILRGCK